MAVDYSKEIRVLTKEIEANHNDANLLYERGFFYFLSDLDDCAKEDYKKALELGLDFTLYPYYSFSNSNEKRRSFLLPEKILVVLILILVIVSIIFEVFSFINKYFL